MLAMASSGCRQPIASAFLGTSMLLLGVGGYVRWGSNRAAACRMHAVLAEAVVLSMAVLFLSMPTPTIELFLVATAIGTAISRAVSELAAPSMQVQAAAVYSAACYTVFQLGGIGDSLLLSKGLAFILGAFVVWDRGDVSAVRTPLSGVAMWRTAVVYSLQTAGILTLFAWSQTLPLGSEEAARHAGLHPH